MKFSLIFSFFICSFYVFSQDSYILKKDGSRIELVKNSIQLIVQDKLLTYKTLGSNSVKELDFSSINEVYFGNYKFKYFKFKDTKVASCYFVLSESEKYTLIFIGNPESVSDEGELNVKIKYSLYILDKSNNIIDAHTFSNQNTASKANDRSLISEKIKLYFKDCDNLMLRLSDYEKSNEPYFMGMLGFFQAPNFINCSP